MSFLNKIFILYIALSVGSFAHADMERALKLYSQGRYKEAIPELLVEAENGNLLAKYRLSEMYLGSWYSTPEDIANRNKWEKTAYDEFLELANNGNSEAQYYLGLMYCEGSRADSSVDKLDKCLYWLRLASKNGSSEASNYLGFYYENAGQDINEAIRMYELSVEQGNVFSAGQLGQIFGKLINGVAKDKEKAIKWYSKTFDMWEKQINPNYEIRDWASHLFNSIAKNYIELNDLENSVRAYRKSAELGDEESMVELAIFYMKGEIVEKERDMAVNWLLKANLKEQQDQLAEKKAGQNRFGEPIDNGEFNYYDFRNGTSDETDDIVRNRKFDTITDPAIQNEIGDVYINYVEYRHIPLDETEFGDEILENYQNALEWYSRAAEKGYIEAYRNLGKMYDKGKGIGANYEKALKWYKLAANEGDAPSQNNLGVMLANGRGTNPDLKAAYRWFEKAANGGDDFAKINLAIMLGKGLGVAQNNEAAAKWFSDVLKTRVSGKNRILIFPGPLAENPFFSKDY